MYNFCHKGKFSVFRGVSSQPSRNNFPAEPRMQPLATFTPADLTADRQRCLVTQDNRVYDVTSFLPDHPGGADLIETFRGKDVKDIMANDVSHAHSDAAFEMLQEFLVGI